MTDNKNLNSIDIYSFSTKKLVKRIEVNDSTHKYIRLIHGFWPITGDSVLVYNYQRISPLLLLLNDWQVTGRHEYNLRGFLNHGSMTASPSVVLGNKIYFTEFPIGDINNLIHADYAPEVIYDMAADSVYNSDITWPALYKNGKWQDLFMYCKTLDDDKQRIVYSWEASDDLLIRQEEGLYVRKAKSDYFKNAIRYDIGKSQEQNRIENNHYTLVLYDKYRKVYYRYAIHGIPFKNSAGGENSHFDAPFSIIILDENFNKIGEVRLPGKTYLPKDSFVGEKGLYISNHNYRNEELPEDVMSFSVFQLVANK